MPERFEDYLDYWLLAYVAAGWGGVDDFSGLVFSCSAASDTVLQIKDGKSY